jgi:thiol:disulfide interchange protein DsbA
MRFVHLVAALVVALPLATLPATASAAEAGKDYTVLANVQPTDDRSKVEVIEFFAYTCPHCFHLEPMLNAWAKKLPKNVVLKREPVVFSDSWEPMARAYFALQALGVVDKLHDDVFNAIHVQNINLMNPETFFTWGAQHGLDRAKLKATYESFTVSAKINESKQMARAYGITGVPTLAVNGKYVTSASIISQSRGGLPEEQASKAMLSVVDDLIRMESKAPAAKKRK